MDKNDEVDRVAQEMHRLAGELCDLGSLEEELQEAVRQAAEEYLERVEEIRDELAGLRDNCEEELPFVAALEEAIAKLNPTWDAYDLESSAATWEAEEMDKSFQNAAATLEEAWVEV
jgi:hypothetical protein